MRLPPFLLFYILFKLFWQYPLSFLLEVVLTTCWSDGLYLDIWEAPRALQNHAIVST